MSQCSSTVCVCEDSHAAACVRLHLQRDGGRDAVAASVVMVTEAEEQLASEGFVQQLQDSAAVAVVGQEGAESEAGVRLPGVGVLLLGTG